MNALSETDNANAEAIRRLVASEAVLVGLTSAEAVLPGIGEDDFLHAGPPLSGWGAACGALQGAIIGTLLHIGRARTEAEALAIADSGVIRLVPASDHGVLATYGGVITKATKLFVVENSAGATRAFAAVNEGRGKALRYGSHDSETLAKYSWLEGDFTEVLDEAVRAAGGIDLFALLRQALHMGDDGHTRQRAASSLFANMVAPFIVETCRDRNRAARVLQFLAENEIFHLPLTMAGAKAAMLSAEGISHSSIITCMAGNGVEWGIKVSGTGDRWFTAPVPRINGTYFEGFSAGDSSPVIGDSEIAETFGLGACAASGAPALARYMGGSYSTAMQMALEMYAITVAEHPKFRIPALDYRGTPLGIDVRRVVETGIEPLFNTGIAHRRAGIGQIGAGFGRTPIACCRNALDCITRTTH